MINRIRIIGVAGTGKTTLAKKIARIMKCKCYKLDDYYWKRKFDIKRPDRERRAMLKKVAIKKQWVIEGGSSSWTKISFRNADIILCLYAPLHKAAYRILKRYIHRKYFTSNKYNENLKDVIELIRYSNYKKNLPITNKKSFKRILKPYRHKILHLHTNKQINDFLHKFKQKSL